MTRAWIDGAWTDQIPVTDLGFQQGWGLFETIGVFGGVLPLWSRHLARLEASAQFMGINWEPPADLRGAATQLLEETGDDVLRITLTAGDGRRPRWVLSSRRRSLGWDTRVLRLMVGEWRRSGREPLAAHKTTSYAFHAVAAARARARGGDDAVILDTAGEALEATTGNLIFEIGNRLLTPAGTGLLPGVARGVLCEALAGSSRPIESEHIPWSVAQRAERVIVCNAVYGPRPAWLAKPDQAEPVPALTAAWQRAVSG